MAANNTQSPNRNLAWILFWIIFAGLTVFFYLFHLAGVTIVEGPWFIRVPDLPPVAQGQVITAAVTWLGGVGALCTFLYNFNQKERLLQLQKEVEGDKAKRERDLAELQRLEAEFSGLVRDYSSKEEMARISATIGLSEIAKKPDPRRVSMDALDPPNDEKHYATLCLGHPFTANEYDSRTWPEHWRTDKSERNYPYFKRSVDRLATGLLLWNDDHSGTYCHLAIIDLAKWSAAAGTDEPLLHYLVNVLAQSNRNAVKSLRIILDKLPDDIDSLILFDYFDFRNWRGGNLSLRPEAIESLRSEYLDWIVHYSSTAVSTYSYSDFVSTTELPRNEILAELVRSVQRLERVTDTLCECLRHLNAPPELIEVNFPENVPNREISSALALHLTNRRGLKLHGVSLVKSNCQNVNLQGANLEDGALFFSDLENAKFDFATLGKTILTGTFCLNTSFIASHCESARFEHSGIYESSFVLANCSTSQFNHASCGSCNMHQSNLDCAFFENVSIQSCDFRQAIMLCVNLSEASIVDCDFSDSAVAHCYVWGDRTIRKFERNRWETANFSTIKRDMFTGAAQFTLESDSDLWHLFNELDPEVEPRIPPWERDS